MPGREIASSCDCGMPAGSRSSRGSCSTARRTHAAHVTPDKAELTIRMPAEKLRTSEGIEGPAYTQMIAEATCDSHSLRMTPAAFEVIPATLKAT